MIKQRLNPRTSLPSLFSSPGPHSFQKIETAMAGMAAKIAQHKESMRALKPKPGIETLYKKVVAKAQKRR